jgi:hypothetical protein
MNHDVDISAATSDSLRILLDKYAVSVSTLFVIRAQVRYGLRCRTFVESGKNVQLRGCVLRGSIRVLQSNPTRGKKEAD